MAEKFCLKWNDFQTNINNSFRKLRCADDFYDVTLVSDDQKQVSAHKVVLSASSEYFKNILKSNKHSHPLLCLNGVNSKDLNNILDYMYNGEIQVYQENLDPFLQIAQRFQLEGLIQNEEMKNKTYDDHWENNFQEVGKSEENYSNMPVAEAAVHSNIMLPKYERIIAIESENFNSIEELDHKIEEMIERLEGRTRKCKICGKISRDSMVARDHAETHIDGLSFPCKLCNKIFRTRNSLRKHSEKLNCVTKM